MESNYYYESEMYREALTRETELSVKILSARLELMKMEHEIESYRRSGGEESAYKSAKDRFDCLKEATSLAAIIDDELYIQRLMNEQLVREKLELNKKITSLEAKIEAYNKAWSKM